MQCNTTVNDIYEIIDNIAPFSEQCEWDNSGLLVGGNKKVEKVGVVLDITPNAVEQAHSLGVDLIVSHHPVIFTPVKTFLQGSIPYMLAEYGIAAICAHTSLDKARGGVNDALAHTLGFNAVPVFTQGDEVMLRVAEIAETGGEALAEYVAEKLDTAVSLVDTEKSINRVALCGGAGGDFIQCVISSGCDAYITGEVKHNHYLEAAQGGLTLIEAGHFETENPVTNALADLIREKADCEVICLKQSPPRKFIR